jgi:hypothetical protein
MRHVLLILLLSLFSNSASAEWVRLGMRFFDGKKFSDAIYYDNTEVDDKFTAFTVYANLSTIRRNGHKIKMRGLISLSKPMPVKDTRYMSLESVDEYDCTEKTYRSISSVYFAEPMRRGPVVARGQQPSDWYPFEPVSLTSILFRAACKKSL